MSKTTKMMYIALLSAFAVALSLIEGIFPSPFPFAPGAKLGLSNIITLVAIFTLPYKDSFTVVWIRLLLSTLLGGTFSTFLYSFAGAMLSYFSMLLVRLLGPERVSVIGISATGGIMHNVGQLIVASTIAGSFSVMLYLPVLSFFGIIAGAVVGLAVNYLLEHVAHIEKMFQEAAYQDPLSYRWYRASYEKKLLDRENE